MLKRPLFSHCERFQGCCEKARQNPRGVNQDHCIWSNNTLEVAIGSSFSWTNSKLQLTRWNLSRVLNSGSGHLNAIHSCCYWAKLPNLKLKTRPKQLIGSNFNHPAIVNKMKLRGILYSKRPLFSHREWFQGCSEKARQNPKRGWIWTIGFNPIR